MKKVKRLYIAYGSNLNINQMNLRCPGARIYAKGELKDYRLAFKGGALNGYLTIIKSVGLTLPVVLWCVEASDEKALDRFEGYPNFYDKKDAEVTLENGEKVIGFIYIMNEKFDFNLPSRSYFKTVEEGYRSFNLEFDKLIEAYRYSAKALNII